MTDQLAVVPLGTWADQEISSYIPELFRGLLSDYVIQH